MFDLSKLPPFRFVGDGDSQLLDLSRAGARIQGVADLVARHFQEKEVVGIIYRSTPQLVITWLGVVLAGRTPCILQYPTEKLSHEYWRKTLEHTISSCGIGGLIHGPELLDHRPERLAPTLLLDGTEPECPFRGTWPTEGLILQLSSGTTGFKKGTPFTFQQLVDHARSYNTLLRLGPGDCVVSWLPLYHDMGFIACFIMPMLLGIPVVMMDPMAWVRKPTLLFDAITTHGGTVCFMPNFAFEVMSHHASGQTFPSMRHWISCSETTYAETMDRFLAATQTESTKLSNCYAMAENVFAVCQSSGLRRVVVEGRSHLTCGRPIPGTQVKLVEGEIWVRSPHSLMAYSGGTDVRDAEGYYATGDLGWLHDGELIVTGRKRDLVNVAGRKYMLNDLDLQLSTVFPDSAGRIAALSRYAPELGTERLTILFEQARFWEWRPESSVFQHVKDATGLESFECFAVPPGFITKTSSGKINRSKTMTDWLAAREALTKAPSGRSAPRRVGTPGSSIRADAEGLFGSIPWDRPLKGVLDSMGVVVLRLFCEDHGVPFDLDSSLAGLINQGPATAPEPEVKDQVFSIVALTDGLKLGFGAEWKFADEAFLEAVSRIVNGPVRMEHIAAPPIPILLSDLIFHDYFMLRMPGPEYAALGECLQKIKQASLLIVDDEDNFRLPPFCVYPRLDHRFINDPLADHLAHRWTRYTQKHHLLPRKIVKGRDVEPSSITPAIQELSSYLDRPVMRMAFHEEFRAYTQHWDHCDYRAEQGDSCGDGLPFDLLQARESVIAFVQKHRHHCQRTSAPPQNRFIMDDPPHFCSFLINPEIVAWAVERFHSFCILGPQSSLPALEQALVDAGKAYFYSAVRNPERTDFDCFVMTGASGFPVTNKPILELVHAGEAAGRMHNLDPQTTRECPFPMLGTPEVMHRVKDEYLVHAMPLGNYFLNGGQRSLPPEWMETP